MEIVIIILIQSSMHVKLDKSKIEIAMSEDHEWVERIGKTTNEILLIIQQYNRIKLNDRRSAKRYMKYT